MSEEREEHFQHGVVHQHVQDGTLPMLNPIVHGGIGQPPKENMLSKKNLGDQQFPPIKHGK